MDDIYWQAQWVISEIYDRISRTVEEELALDVLLQLKN